MKILKKTSKAKAETSNSIAWKRVQLARHPQRPFTMDYINKCFTGFSEIHGDRAFGDDNAIIAGLAYLNGQPVVVIGQQKGRDTKENIKRNFAMPHPEGYRKALRLMKLAEKFNRPIITFIDTPGAYPGLGAEERGQAEAIARNLLEMAKLKVPVIAVIIGEGGSGGALGIGIGNKVLMLENAIYSVISPEGFAAILWNDRARMQEAADLMKMTAPDLLAFKIVDEIVPEPEGGAHTDIDATTQNLKKALEKNLKALSGLTPAQLEDQRYNKFRAMGSLSK
ncbi:MAG TPA: acetyl-CoA carboxylase carboxyltransferase subunit alpha [bacterium]|nr:acetyl-CoA carboxylase carboxyltransferase subunit alpha [bacterium]